MNWLGEFFHLNGRAVSFRLNEAWLPSRSHKFLWEQVIQVNLAKPAILYVIRPYF